MEKVVDSEEILLQKCKTMIRARLGWEESDSWTNQDFQLLSEKIQEGTGINLSVATLKRIWGKVKYDSKPTNTTLNTLAQYLGYENWRAFKQANYASTGNGHADIKPGEHLPDIQGVSKVTSTKKRWRFGVVGTALSVSVLFIFLYALKKEDTPGLSPDEYEFSSKKVVSEGVPNTVIFDYDASAAPFDSVFIQQSWDERLRKQVPRDGHQHTSIYYQPGFFQAKLVIGKQVVRQHDLWIKSNGWIALVKTDEVPVYFADADFKKPGMLSLPVTKLKDAGVPFQPQLPWTSYYNVMDFGDLRTNDFVFETEVRSDYNEGAGVCQFANILLLTEGSVASIPLSIKGCVSDISLYYDGKGVEGKKADLSAFGCDMSQWTKVRCEARNNQTRILINDTVAYETAIEDIPRRIVGLICRFQGTGSIRNVKLSTGAGENVYEENFQNHTK